MLFWCVCSSHSRYIYAFALKSVTQKQQLNHKKENEENPKLALKLRKPIMRPIKSSGKGCRDNWVRINVWIYEYTCSSIFVCRTAYGTAYVSELRVRVPLVCGYTDRVSCLMIVYKQRCYMFEYKVYALKHRASGKKPTCISNGDRAHIL